MSRCIAYFILLILLPVTVHVLAIMRSFTGQTVDIVGGWVLYGGFTFLIIIAGLTEKILQLEERIKQFEQIKVL